MTWRLYQWWLNVNWTIGNQFQWILNTNTRNFIQENAFEIAVCKMVIILFRPKYVDTSGGKLLKISTISALRGNHNRDASNATWNCWVGDVHPAKRPQNSSSATWEGVLPTLWSVIWGRVTYTCVSKLAIIGSGNGLSPGRRRAIIWTNDGTLLIGPFGTNLSKIVIEIRKFSFKKMRLKTSPV